MSSIRVPRHRHRENGGMRRTATQQEEPQERTTGRPSAAVNRAARTPAHFSRYFFLFSPCFCNATALQYATAPTMHPFIAHNSTIRRANWTTIHRYRKESDNSSLQVKFLVNVVKMTDCFTAGIGCPVQTDFQSLDDVETSRDRRRRTPRGLQICCERESCSGYRGFY